MTKLMIVGEAWGKDEEAIGHPFVGASGQLLLKLLDRTGLMPLTSADRHNIDLYYREDKNPAYTAEVWHAHPEVRLTNVFALRPRPTNDIKNLCGPKATGIPGWPALSQGKYVRAEYADHLERLFAEIHKVRPNLVLALGATPTWALSKRTGGIKAARGSPFLSPHLKVKVLPTYHPAAALRDGSVRPIIYADMTKAMREQEFPDVRAPDREIWIEPTLADLTTFEREYIHGSRVLSVDIETKGGSMTCIGFAPSRDRALVVPFWDAEKPSGNYWGSAAKEAKALRWVKRVLAEHPRVLFQNGLFDMHWLWRVYGITVPGADDDTMLLHHALQPEMQKSLAFLASVYTEEPQWKFMRKSAKKEDQ